MTPVIGFYCQKCEEFIGDLNSAENHAAIHYHRGCSSVSIHLIYLCVDEPADFFYFEQKKPTLNALCLSRFNISSVSYTVALGNMFPYCHEHTRV